jgi:hypothetical protein
LLLLLVVRVCGKVLGDTYFGFLAEAEPGESHELALAVGEGVLGVDNRSHAGMGQLAGLEERDGRTHT